ncbi:MAG: transglutaminase domain-containing protein [Deltaproteobacteria bacterium]|nr:transglutaminase domain-containing protein [Deltaproteobacteria bacterium]
MNATLLLLALALVPAADGPAPGTRSERLQLFVAGSRAGTIASVDEPLPDGGWRLTRHADMEVQRGALRVRLVSRSVTEVGPDYAPRSFHYMREQLDGRGQSLEAGGRLVCDGKAACDPAGCAITVTTALGATPQTKVVRLPRGATFASAVEAQLRRTLRAGTRWEGKMFLEELADMQDASWSVEKEAGGFVIRTRVAGVDTVDHVDAAGRTLKSETPVMSAVALPEGSKEIPGAGGKGLLDVLAQSTWKGPVVPEGVKRVRFELTTREGDVAAVPEGRHQRVVKRELGRVVVEVVRLPKGPAEKLSADEKQRALAATPYEPLSDPRVREAAAKARGNATRPRDIVRNVILWVNDYVDDKDLSRAYAPATATLQTRQGDCTEHSVLASALLKANGIPTRLADGVIWFQDNLGYHEWVEVFLDGEGWVPADPTFGEPEAGPNRVKFANGSSDPSDLMIMGLSAAQAFRGLRVTVADSDPAAK